jgi:hypothetical protein
MAKSSVHIILRFFVEVEGSTEAERIANNVKKRIQTFGSINKYDIKQYWKIPQYYEVLFDLAPTGDIEASFTDILSSLASGWEMQGAQDSRWAVWKPTSSATPFFDAIRWASLEII